MGTINVSCNMDCDDCLLKTMAVCSKIISKHKKDDENVELIHESNIIIKKEE